jgi:hypothetical protein
VGLAWLRTGKSAGNFVNMVMNFGCHKTRELSLRVQEIFAFEKGLCSIEFFFGEGPRSRCYGRTAALRLIVQHCDEDERKMIIFFLVS